MPELSIELIAFLFAIALLAGMIDTLAGGGGLLTLPALIVSGLPPLAALGTNKLQSTVGTGMATFMMLKHKKVTWRQVKWTMLSAFIGSTLGTIFIQFLDTAFLSWLIPLVLSIIAFYFLFAKAPHELNRPHKVSDKTYQRFVLPTIGAYDGMFGPGTGSFFSLAGVSLKGQGLLQATVTAKTLNFATNAASLIVFIFAGHVVWVLGSIMMLGQLFGAWLGSHFLFRINPTHLRYLVALMCLAMLIKYLISA
ncbi:TSUP family transporter [Hydrogenovibrio kuenenii]|uniref:TSUP family transporter n=1 Tax=Hydrogenovibrio kuenenii TaxID=63658 RepID=UPI00046628DD|nr:TSUP family transporter [Hydrogenovibrio kuenenii]